VLDLRNKAWTRYLCLLPPPPNKFFLTPRLDTRLELVGLHMDSTISRDTFRARMELDHGPLDGRHHRDAPQVRYFSSNSNTFDDRRHVSGAHYGRFSRVEAPTGAVEQPDGARNLRQSGAAQQRAFPAEAEVQTAPGTNLAFPRGLSALEIDRWKRLEEQGAPLRAQRLDAVAKGDEEAERGAMEALRRLQRVKQVLQDRMEELWSEEEWFSSRQARMEGVHSPSRADRSPSPP
jgi:hypothetical protein